MKMKHFVWVMVAMLAIPTAGFAMKHMENEEHGKMEMKEGGHQDMQGMEHGSMKMDGNMIMLKTEDIDGVAGAAHLKDVKDEMAKHGMTATHHFMVNFTNAAGETMDQGMVAVKVEDPDGNISDPIKLMGMQGHFGADIALDKKGMYKFQVGTKLADGKKRTFNYHYENK